MHKSLPGLVKFWMWWDYLSYMVFLQPEETFKLLTDIFIFGLSVFLLQHEIFSITTHDSEVGALSSVLVLIILKFIWETYGTHKEIQSFFKVQESILRSSADLKNLLPDQKERDMGYVPVEIPFKHPEVVFVSEKINRYLQTTPLSIAVSSKKQQRVHQYIRKHREILLQYFNYYFYKSLRQHRLFTNDRKFCLSKDIRLNSREVACHFGNYYDSFLTNQVSGTTLIIKDKKHTMVSTEHIFPEVVDESGQRYLNDITSSPMNHHIGCSTIGFTKDNYLIVWVQANKTEFSSNQLVPTGSGSANVEDIEDNNLQKTVKNTMERELYEESSVSPKKYKGQDQTLILGFYRWVARGGKPEFVGITKLSEKAENYKPAREELKTDIAVNHYRFRVDSVDQLPGAISDIRKKGQFSVPLFMCLYHLEKMLKNHPEELNEFMFGQGLGKVQE